MRARVLALFAASIFAPPLRSYDGLPPAQTQFLDQYCADCHDADVKKGGLDLTSLKFDLKDESTRAMWETVFRRVHHGEMPPKKKEQPTAQEKEAFLTALEKPISEADATDIAANGRVRSRRLTRTEYEHTLHDLLGIDIPLKHLLPEDPASHGFETVAHGQQLSHHQLARYLDTADQALSEAFTRAEKGDEPWSMSYTPEMLAKRGRGNYRGPDVRNGKSISWPITLQFFGRMPTFAPESGWYRITLKQVEGINPTADGAVWGTLRSGHCESNTPMLYMIGLVEATRTPRDLTFEAWIEEGHRLELRPNDATLKRAPSGANGGNVSFQGRDLAKEGYSGIAHRGIHLERIHPGGSRDLLQTKLFGDKRTADKIQATDLDSLITRFAGRAFRRPATSEQTSPYRQISTAAMKDGASPLEAYRSACRAILCSPRFLTFVEPPGKLDDYAIASRLSYALWCSTPDSALNKLAAEGKLRDPGELSRQIERLLSHRKATRFIHSFTDQWLKMNQIDFTTPDTRLFPGFDTVVQQSMLEETRTYFTEMLSKDLNITHLVDSDFVFLNGRLARHYAGSPPAEKKPKNKKNRKEPEPAKPASTMPPGLKPGDGLQRVSLPPSSQRGGLVTHGAVLKVTADGTTTSPVVRGVFINERILGTHLAPPPPGIPAIEPDIRGATSIRDQLEKHRASETCAGCHQTIDPPGLALENYDPVGVWRTGYGRGNTGAPVNPAGITPDGSPFTGLMEWQKLYSQRPQQLAKGFASHFLTYATGAPPRFHDSHTLDTIAKDTHGLRSIIRAVILSDVFQIK